MIGLSPLLLAKNKIIHIVGIGGIGMSGIAKLLHNLGHIVQGSDKSANANVAMLCKLGINVFSSHKESNIQNISMIIRSTAIPDSNVEIKEARKIGLPVISRAEILTELLKLKHTIAISGTHGKTTTTSMLGAIFDIAEYDPTIISGGIMNLYNDNIRLGDGNWNIVEADESDGTFISLQKSICIVTNIEIDHIEYYKSHENLLDHFRRFINKVPFHGFAVACKKSIKMLDIKNEKLITYSLADELADVYATNIKHKANKTNFDIITSDKLNNLKISDVSISVPGDHNICNALAATAVAVKLGITEDKVKLGLKKYSGVKRRFSNVGRFNGAYVIDDYAHHPTEIIETIKTAYKLCSHNNKVIAVIQPHRFTRVKSLFDKYVNIASYCDHTILLPVFSAGEEPIKGYDSTDIIAESKKRLHTNHMIFSDSLNEFKRILEKVTKNGDIILLMGAGDITTYAKYIT